MRIRSVADLPGAMRMQVDALIGKQVKAAKYRNDAHWADGERFDSLLEWRCYEGLKLRRAAGEVAWFIRQVPFRLEGGVIYRADFLVVLASGGVEVIDAKGYDTQASRNKRRQVKARYGVEVILWTDRRRS